MIDDRITIIKDDDYDYQCDLCDKHKKDTPLTFLSWACWHDDDYIKTIVCIECLVSLTREVVAEIN